MAKNKKIEQVNLDKSRVFFCGPGMADEQAMEEAAAILENDKRYTLFRQFDVIVIIWNDDEETPIHPYFLVSSCYRERNKTMPKLAWGEGWTGQKIHFKNCWLTLV